MAKRPRKFSVTKEIRAIARERVGTVKPSQPIIPKSQRKKPKYKKDLAELDSSDPPAKPK